MARATGMPRVLDHITAATRTNAALLAAFAGSAQYSGHRVKPRHHLASAPFATLLAFTKGLNMKIIWLGHSGFRIETEGAVLLIDPWLSGNPMFPADRAGLPPGIRVLEPQVLEPIVL
jgi:hypothetical protein